jgi:hypothetical protein
MWVVTAIHLESLLVLGYLLLQGRLVTRFRQIVASIAMVIVFMVYNGEGGPGRRSQVEVLSHGWDRNESKREQEGTGNVLPSTSLYLY